MSLTTSPGHVLDPEERLAYYSKLRERARADIPTWCRLVSRGQWVAARHATYMLDRVRTNCEDGGCKRTIVSVSVRHSKSDSIAQKFVSWWIGAHPEERTIVGTAEADLAEINSVAARTHLTEFGRDVFGVTVDQTSSAKKKWDLKDHAGGLTAVGRGGSPEGRGGNILIDDPYRNFKDAMSPTTRKDVRDWWQHSLRPRMEPGSWAIIICSRWHVDDLSGWLLKEFGEDWDEIRLPALADDPNDPLGREIGEPLWPERWSIEELALARRETQAEGGEITWSARYQQKPLDMSSQMFPADKWEVIDSMDDDRISGVTIVKRARGWDLAASEATGDWTVGVLMALLSDGRYFIEDIVRAQKGPDGVRELMKITAAADRGRTGIYTTQVIPQDPGQAGKDQVTQLARVLAPSPTESRAISGDKITRAVGYASIQRTGSIVMMEGPHGLAFRSIHSSFPGEHDDDVDAAADAFNFLAGGVVVVDAGAQDAYGGMMRQPGLG